MKKFIFIILFLLLTSNCFGAITLGTNAGFVTTAPTADPAGANPDTGDQGYNNAGGIFIAPAGTNQLTEIGVYINNDITGGGGLELGIYSDSAGNNRPALLLASKTGLTVSAGAGWKVGTLDTPYALTAGVKYWLVAAFAGTNETGIDMTLQAGSLVRYKVGQTLVSDWGTTALGSDRIVAIYGVYNSTVDVTIHPATNDTYIQESAATTNYNANTALLIKNINTASRKTILEFDFSASVPAGSTIDSANLGLYYYAYTGNTAAGKTWNCAEVLRTDWVSAQATWNIYKTDSNWSTAGAGSDGNDYTTTNQVSATVPAALNWVNWTPTVIVQDALDNHSGIVRFIIYQVEADAGVLANCYSSNYTTNLSLRPTLTVNYTEGGGATTGTIMMVD